MKQIPALIFCLFSFFSYTQESKPFPKNKFMLMVSPIHLIELYHGNSFNFGAEFYMSEKYNFYAEYGRYIKKDLFSYNYDQTGFTILAEIKRYFKQKQPGVKTYVSLQYLYGEQQYTRLDYTENQGNKVIYNVDKVFRDVSTRIGAIYVHNNHLVFNPYFGIGFRRHNNKTNLSATLQNEIIQDYLGFPYPPIHIKGIKMYPKVHFGLRIGWRFF